MTAPTESPLASQWTLYRQTLKQARELEGLAEQWRMEAENAAEDVALLKAEGRARVAERIDRMLPLQKAGADYVTNGFKVVQDAKGDHVLFLQRATMYATLAQMKYAKAATIKPTA